MKLVKVTFLVLAAMLVFNGAKAQTLTMTNNDICTVTFYVGWVDNNPWNPPYYTSSSVNIFYTVPAGASITVNAPVAGWEMAGSSIKRSSPVWGNIGVNPPPNVLTIADPQCNGNPGTATTGWTATGQSLTVN